MQIWKPDDPEYHFENGNVLKELKRYESSLASNDKALSLRSDYVEAHNNRGTVLKELRRLDEALLSYNRAPDTTVPPWDGRPIDGEVFLWAEQGMGASSHSGRRTAITNWARKISTVGGSLRDVQMLAWHSALSTTQRYIEAGAGAMKRVVALVWQHSRCHRYE